MEIRTKKITVNENSLISELNNQMNMQKHKYYFKIRNNFDYENETRSSINIDSSSISQRDKRSNISGSFVQGYA